ncbi:MAG: hypothetical protein AAFV92_13040 [Pseudomonadota bacterium]
MSTSAITKPPDADGARAPGKLILSGEHSVVYGCPAVVVAIARYIDVWFTPLHKTNGLQTAFETLAPRSFYPFDVLKSFKDGLDKRFDEFMRGELPVQKILSKPDDLAIYTLTSLLPKIPAFGSQDGLPLPVPGQLTSRSDMPLGAGMGSSAAVVAATIVLYEHLLSRSQSVQDRFQKVRFCERLQHGKGSAIDASAVVFGGMNRVQGDDVLKSFAKPHLLKTVLHALRAAEEMFVKHDRRRNHRRRRSHPCTERHVRARGQLPRNRKRQPVLRSEGRNFRQQRGERVDRQIIGL